MALSLLASVIGRPAGPPEAPTLESLDDARQWLEDVEGSEALAWVKAKNSQVVKVLGEPEKHPTYERILSILDSKEKIPAIGRVLDHKGRGTLYYNYWQDKEHAKGIWRRCTLKEFRKKEPAWEVVLDLDKLSAEEGITWVWGGSVILDEGPNVPTSDTALIKLSRGGADAKEVREFDLEKKRFIPASEGGFFLPEAKVSVCWKDRDTLWVGGSFFGEAALTDSGYPRTVHEWKRGTELASAKLLFEGERADVAVGGTTWWDRGVRYDEMSRAVTFWTNECHLRIGSQGALTKLSWKPDDANVGTFADQLVITLRSEWLGFKAGSMLVGPAAELLAIAADTTTAEAKLKKILTAVFAPTETASLDGTSESLNYLILSVLDNVRSETRFWRFDASSRKFTLESTSRGENFAMVSASGVQSDKTDAIWVTSYGYTLPQTYALADASSPTKLEELKALPQMYDASKLVVQQYFATSADGTKVPYFLVCRKGMPRDGSTPTLLYGYGGFEISETPRYAATIGVGWLEKGYAYAAANIRGGGEFGPTWHQAALKEKRHKAYEDFEAVARDLVARGVTSHAALGCQGGSNGGLLVGNMLARSPELWRAIVCQVPLLDMRRFNKLLAGASWMGEYGNPDEPKEWEYLRHNSPYHTLQPKAKTPLTLFTTSTRDDRVHPAHARKLAGKMVDLGMPVLSYENIEGGRAEGRRFEAASRGPLRTATPLLICLGGVRPLPLLICLGRVHPFADGACARLSCWKTVGRRIISSAPSCRRSHGFSSSVPSPPPPRSPPTSNRTRPSMAAADATDRSWGASVTASWWCPSGCPSSSAPPPSLAPSPSRRASGSHPACSHADQDRTECHPSARRRFGGSSHR